MRYATFSTANDPTPRLGVLHAGKMVDVQLRLAGAAVQRIPRTLLELIQCDPSQARRIGDQINARLSATASEGTVDLADIHWHAPIPRPLKNIVCLGLNYASHVRETTKADRPMNVPEIPVFFTKASTSA